MGREQISGGGGVRGRRGSKEVNRGRENLCDICTQNRSKNTFASETTTVD